MLPATAAALTAAATTDTPTLHTAAAAVAAAFAACSDPKQRYQLLLQYASKLQQLPEEERLPSNRVMGCTSQAWVTATLDNSGGLLIRAASDSQLTCGLAALLQQSLNGLPPEALLELDTQAFTAALGLGPSVLTPSRSNGFANLLEALRRRARLLADGPAAPPAFPSLLISAAGLTPVGAFAEAQARYLAPDAAQVDALVSVLSAKKVGVVAHFYMDPEVQGVLSAAAERWPHIYISDSLVMADAAVAMAEAGCAAVAVLGVDFMSENVRAILDEAGHANVGVYRMAADAIGCSLAEAAESDAYASYLADAAATPGPALHVVYINTSLRTKAAADAVVPTITCTSSNVVQTVLQAFAQVPDLHVWYGPDTYMGRNLARMFQQVAQLSDEDIAVLHPAHNRESVAALLPRLHHFADGTCIVHHIFGGETAALVRRGYGDAFLTAHFEVPGEMFELAVEARARGMGVVGSTSNILDFIAAKTSDALASPAGAALRFVLGTEAGMITSIVRRVQALLRASGRTDVSVEIVFPVSPDAIVTPSQQVAGAGVGGGAAPAPALRALPAGVALLPGAAGGEGCSLEGGCATCPYMKMNTLTALLKVASRVRDPGGEATLARYEPRAYAERMASGKSMAAAGCVPILHMRHFSQRKALSEDLVDDILARAKRPAATTA